MLIRRLSIVVVALVALFAGCAVMPDDERIGFGPSPCIYVVFPDRVDSTADCGGERGGSIVYAPWAGSTFVGTYRE